MIRTVPLTLIAFFTIAASSPQCASVDSPVAPREEVPTEPLLIGGSPLLLNGCIQLPVPFSGDWFVEVHADLNKGIAKVARENRFLIRTSVTFTKDGSDLVGLQPCVDKPIPAKPGEFRAGKSTEVLLVVPISDAVKDALLAADDSGTGGSNPVAHVLLELLLSADSETVLDAVEASASVDPNGDS